MNLIQQIKSIRQLSSLLLLAILGLSGCGRLGESIAQVLPANEVPLMTAAVSQTSNTATVVGASNQSSEDTVVALKPEGFVQADIDSEYGEMMVVDDLEQDMGLLDMAHYISERNDPNSMLAASMETGEETLGGDDGITGLLFGEDFEMMTRDMPKEDPYIKEKAALAQSIDITEEYTAYYGYGSKPMQRQESRRPSQRARTMQTKPSYPNIRDYLKNRSN